MNKILINIVVALSLSAGSASVWSNASMGGINSLGVYDISIDTSTLNGISAGLSFDFLANSPGFADFVRISNFETDGAFDFLSFDTFGDVSVNPGSNATLGSSVDFSQFFQPLVLGDFVNFRLDFRNDPDAVLPGSTDFQNIFTVTLTDETGEDSLVQTDDSEGTDALLQADFSITLPQTAALSIFNASGLTITATPVAAVPLPAALPLMGFAISILAGLQKRRKLLMV
ncbi:MAG: hypothetical protein CTY24_02235 [Methylobacter sp.]|nr:MAG: hypothetical protein CTY24_02235 [Methylobacter sp.]